MATDYDAPRRSEEDPGAEPLEALQTHRSAPAQPSSIDVDEPDTAEGIELPGADLSGEELNITVVPVQTDEFTCANGLKYCKECEG